ncbi:hypothetical protein HRTV-24_gp125 [Halorubrum virus HRTV-24]|nr:hypothetical protein HRTV-24_gp125 [Halorubrum virus HRTV-24]UBF22010.1 hypothetical protein HJTV-3_gp121 [Haloarcula virus HJTV-3]UBF22139.1 hypothetical protein HRTV-15_gp120 [Halorubrum virus HRTV-15]
MPREAVATVRLRSGASGSPYYRVTPMAVATATSNDRRIDLSEPDLERKVGDYVLRLRRASVAKFYDDEIWWGGIEVIPSDDSYLIRGIDGEMREPIPRDGQYIEQLVALFDRELENALNDL